MICLFKNIDYDRNLNKAFNILFTLPRIWSILWSNKFDIIWIYIWYFYNCMNIILLWDMFCNLLKLIYLLQETSWRKLAENFVVDSFWILIKCTALYWFSSSVKATRKCFYVRVVCSDNGVKAHNIRKRYW